MLRCDKLRVGYSPTKTWEINISCSPGNVYLVIGPNGSGKSTALKGLSGQLHIYSGTCEFDSHPIDFTDRNKLKSLFLYVPQQPQWLFLGKNFARHIKKIERIYRVKLLDKFTAFLKENEHFTRIVSTDFKDLSPESFYIFALMEDILFQRNVLILDECPTFHDSTHYDFFKKCLYQRNKKNLITIISQHHEDNINFSNTCIDNIFVCVNNCIWESSHD